LQAELARLEHAYYVLDNPLLPDIEYDRLYRELLDIEATHPEWITSESLSQRVGGAALKEFDSVTHEVPMLSLNNAFEEAELVAFDRQTKHYRLGIGMLALARSALDSNAFPALIQAGLDQLSTAYNVTAIAVDVSDADQMVVVALSRSTIPFRLHVDVGSVFPSLLSATGRLVAAFSQQSRAELKAQFAKLRWDGSINFDTWYLEVQQAMQNEYSIDRGTYIAGVTIVAVPVRQQNKMPTHTLVCASLTNQLTEADLTDLIMRMRSQADLATSL
jgi:DNA-binding IclR family transcriptional regulator